MKRISLFSKVGMCGVLLFATLGCQAGSRTAERGADDAAQREVSLRNGISRITTQTAIDVIYVQQSGRPYARIEASERILPLVEVSQNGAALDVGYKRGSGNIRMRSGERCVVYVYAPEVTEFTANSAGSIQLERTLRTERDVTIRLNSAGDLKGPGIDCADLSVQLSSAGDAEFDEVRCRQFDVSVSSAGDFHASQVRCDNARLEASSAGDCIIGQLDCKGSVDSRSSSAGSIRIKTSRR